VAVGVMDSQTLVGGYVAMQYKWARKKLWNTVFARSSSLLLKHKSQPKRNFETNKKWQPLKHWQKIVKK
jgi:hypothetical protein